METHSPGNIASADPAIAVTPAGCEAANSHPSATAQANRQTATNAPFVEEVDVWWGAYSGRSTIPDLVTAAVLTAFLFGLGWYFKDWHGNVVRYWLQVATVVFWSAGLLYWLYRMVSTGYRLTTRRLLYYKGLFRPIREEMDLRKVAQVMVEQTVLNSLLNVGQIRIESRLGSQPLVFDSVRDPERIRQEIVKWAERSGANQV